MEKKILNEAEHLKFQLGIARWQIFSSALTAMGAVFISIGFAIIAAGYSGILSNEDSLPFPLVLMAFGAIIFGGFIVLMALLMPTLVFNRAIKALDD